MIDDALKALNQFRREHFNLEPVEEMPKGVKCSSTVCPVAQTLPKNWECGTSWIIDDGDGSIKLPEIVTEFIMAFDDGEFPDLVER